MTQPPTAPTRAWTPILDGSAADRAREVIFDVATALRDREAAIAADPALASAAVADGAPGLALFFAHLARAEGGDWGDVAMDWLDAGLDRAEADPPSTSLYSGTIGVGWLLTYLSGRLLSEEDGAADVDELVTQVLELAPPPAFDLVRGTVGIGVYLLDRLPRPAAQAGLEKAVARLADQAEEIPTGLVWWTDPMTVPQERRERYPKGEHDVGAAHGLAGVVAFLAGAVAADVKGARELLEPAVAALRAYRLPEDVGPGRFPLITHPHSPREEWVGGRAAWCYGDPGVAAGLFAAGRALDDAEITAEAVALARHAADRPIETVGVIDGSLCHGAGGLMHLFNRMAQESGDDRLRAAAVEWFERLLGIRRDDGIAGYPMHRAEGFVPRGGWLDGAAGIALALVAAVTPDEPAWDDLLLLRPPAAAGERA